MAAACAARKSPYEATGEPPLADPESSPLRDLESRRWAISGCGLRLWLGVGPARRRLWIGEGEKQVRLLGTRLSARCR